MKVLHICSDFANQSIYNQMISNLNKFDIKQDIYVPVRSSEEVGKNVNNELKNTKYFYAHILTKLDRINYFGKIKKTTNFIDNNSSINDIDVIHAHFLFSDGGIAYQLYKKYNKPYVVAIRNTDLNLFFKYFLHLRPYVNKILKNASTIIFLSNAYKDLFINKYIPLSDKIEIEKKIRIIPNGIEDFWHHNSPCLPKSLDNFSILYVGNFTPNKNVLLTIYSVAKLRMKGFNVTLNILGGGGSDEKKIRKLSTMHDWINLYSKTNNKEVIKEVYRKSHIFCMPSKYETFGLVYIEALSQGLPIIYTRGQGVSGYFKEGVVGYSVIPCDVDDVVKKLELIINNYHTISLNTTKYSKEFMWDKIVNDYISIYNSLL